MKKLSLLLISFFIIGCATKKHEISIWMPPADGKALEVTNIVIRGNGEDELHKKLKFALAQELIKSRFFTIKPHANSKDTKKTISNFGYTEKISNKSIAIITFDATENYSLERGSTPRVIYLQSCNWMAEKDPCQRIGTQTVNDGIQKISYSMTAVLEISSGGKLIRKPVKITKEYSRQDRFVPDRNVIQSRLSNWIAREFAKKIAPYKALIDIKFIGGDSIAQKMIMHRAYKSAIDRLAELNSKEESAENIYMIGMAYEAMGNTKSAKSFYEEALLKLPENETIKKSLERVKLTASA